MTGPVHATAVAINGAGVLLIGPPGSGKSDLALRLIDRGALLIADDRVVVVTRAGQLMLSPPSTIAGLMEVRGVGLVRMPWVGGVTARVVFDLSRAPERLPDPGRWPHQGIELPLFALAALEQSAPLKVELAVAVLLRSG